MIGAALVQAGGQGLRMRASRGSPHKPLVPVRGVTLLERNLAALGRMGCPRVRVAVPAGDVAITALVRTRGALLAKALSFELEVWVEESPRGTIGAAAEFGDEIGDLLVVNADNLSALDLRALAETHARTRADVTLAAHEEAFQIPYGRLHVEAGRVLAYHEKPTIPVPVCSAYSVLGPRARGRIPRERPCALPDLISDGLAAGWTVSAHEHSDPWVDVNDAASLERAEALLAKHAARFERLREPPEREVVGAVLRCGSRVLLEQRPVTSRAYAGLFDTPGGKVEPGETPVQAIERELLEELGLTVRAPRRVGHFDDVDPTSGGIYRHTVFEIEARAYEPGGRPGLGWYEEDRVPELFPLSAAVDRSLALCRAPELGRPDRDAASGDPS